MQKVLRLNVHLCTFTRRYLLTRTGMRPPTRDRSPAQVTTETAEDNCLCKLNFRGVKSNLAPFPIAPSASLFCIGRRDGRGYRKAAPSSPSLLNVARPTFSLSCTGFYFLSLIVLHFAGFVVSFPQLDCPAFRRIRFPT